MGIPLVSGIVNRADKARNIGDFIGKVGQFNPFYKGIVEPQIKSRELQKANLQRQDVAQKTALSAARSQQRSNQDNKRKANQKEPNTAALLASSVAAGAAGASSTFLSGLGGRLGGEKNTLGGRK